MNAVKLTESGEITVHGRNVGAWVSTDNEPDEFRCVAIFAEPVLHMEPCKIHMSSRDKMERQLNRWYSEALAEEKRMKP